MIILNNYLFIIDALFKGTNYFKGIHIYKLNFEEGFGGGNAANAAGYYVFDMLCTGINDNL